MADPRTRARRLVALATLLAMLLVATPASAADTYAAGVDQACAGSSNGGRDRNGSLYVSCGANVLIVAPDGSQRSVPAPSATGVAPSPDGSVLYLATPTFTGGFRRAVLRNGRYELDATFQPQPVTSGGRTYQPCGLDLATDAYGYIYLSQGGWCRDAWGNPSAIAVVKYRPDGTIVTRFGDFGLEPGLFRTNMGIAVTADGRRVYVAENSNTRVQYFDWTWNGSYRYAGSFSSVETPGGRVAFSATYGVELDAWGYVYVADTTQARIWKLAPDGTYVTRVMDAGDDVRVHYLSVDARGNVFAPETGKLYRRSADNPVPGPYPAPGPEPKPDFEDPVVASVRAPSETTEGSVRVEIAASDDVGVTHMRLADERGTWGGWQAFAAAVDVTLTPGLGTKVIYVQVRDAVGRESNTASAIVSRRPLPDVADPTLSIQAPATTSSSLVQLRVDAADDIGVTHLRVAGDDGEFSEWRAWSSGTATLTHLLAPGHGVRAVAVQVRDAAFRVSPTAYATILVAAPAPVVEEPAPEVSGGGDVPTARRDTVAPRVVRFPVPARSCSRRLVVRIAARDDVRVAMVRFANEDGRLGRWRALRPVLVHFLSRGAGRKLVYVQVRDSAGNTSAVAARRTTLVRCSRTR